ncbi:hypothetical protein [Terriglobus sp.]|uniref:hypothetical protein n=1 Tax=Terriglobus sp. TaxID=1889013 RepID=UPI003B00AA40
MVRLAGRHLPVVAAMAVMVGTGLLSAVRSQSAPGASPSKPLILEQSEVVSPCQSNGMVVHLDPKGDNYLSVQSGPGGKPYVEKDRLHSGQEVYVCDERGGWYGVIYDLSPMRDCKYERSRNGRFEYTGPCKYGWVSKRYVEIIAG